MWVSDRPTELVVPLDSVTRLDVPRRRSNVAWGTGIGLLVGAAAGIIIGTRGEPEVDYDPRWTGGIAGGIWGTLLGAGIGLLIRTDRWEEVSLEELRVTPMATPDGRLGLAVSVRF
jgi:hypothetical protein